MNKNFTPSSIIIPTVNPAKNGPAKLSIEKIRQFARSYKFVPLEIPALGGIIAN